VIAPWREWELTSRTAARIRREHQIPIAKDKRGEAPFSVDANLLHSSSEGKILEDPWEEAGRDVYQRTISPETATRQGDLHHHRFREGRCRRHRWREACRPRRCSPS
jgi:argininosuccinate synthase